jgi:Inositol-pentakisphosphate 2-kinase
MHSSLKEVSGEITAHGYCPLDLFSHRVKRIRKAVNALCRAWIDSNASINNIRVFLDGKLVKPDVSSIYQLRINALTQFWSVIFFLALPCVLQVTLSFR